METPRCLVNKHASTGASPVVSDEMRQLLNWRDGLVFVPQRITLHRRKHSFAGGIQMKSRGVAVLVTLAMIAAIGCGISSSSNPAAPETAVLTASDTFSSGVVGEPVAPATEPFEGYSLIAPLRVVGNLLGRYDEADRPPMECKDHPRKRRPTCLRTATCCVEHVTRTIRISVGAELGPAYSGLAGTVSYCGISRTPMSRIVCTTTLSPCQMETF